MSTFKALSWAFNLRTSPKTKLLAIYIATKSTKFEDGSGMYYSMMLRASEAADWTGIAMDMIPVILQRLPDIEINNQKSEKGNPLYLICTNRVHS